MHCRLTYANPSVNWSLFVPVPLSNFLITLSVLADRSRGFSQIGNKSELSTGISFAFLQPTMQAWHPIHRVESYRKPRAPGRRSFFLASAKVGCPTAARTLHPAAPLRKSRRLIFISLSSLGN